MTAEPYLPDDVTEVGSIHISIGMGKNGTGASFVTEGIAAEAAIGYLIAVTDQLREQVRDRWAGANSFESKEHE